MGIIGGWHPLSGPKVEAVASSRVGLLSAPLAGAIPRPPIPSTSDDGFLLEPCCSGCAESGGCCGGKDESAFAVNVASGSLLYHYHIPENTIPIKVFYESDQTGVSTMGSMGWRTNYHRSIDKAAFSSIVTVVCADGMKAGYTKSGTDPKIYYPPAGLDNLVQEDAVDANIYTEELPSGLKFRYNLSGGTTGRLENLIDPDGRLWTLTYSASGLESVKNHRGRLVTFHYSASKISAIEDSAARRTTFSYDISSRVSSIKASDGTFTTYAYHGVTQRLNTFTDQDGDLTSFSYDGSSRTQDVTADDPAGASGDLTTTFSYGASTGTAKNPLSDLTTYTYDGSSRLTQIHDPEQNLTTYAYDANARVTTVTNARGFTTKYMWEAVTAAGDDTRKRLRGIDPATSGNLTTFGYSGTNYELDEVQDPRGNITTYAYTSRHLSSLVNAKREITTWTYSADVLSAIENPLNYRTTLTFGTNGKVSTIVDAEAKKTTYTYNTAVDLEEVINPYDYRTTSTYDSVNRKTSFRNQLSNRTTFVYTSTGKLNYSIDPLLKLTTFVYNFAGLKTSEFGAPDATRYFTTFNYDKGKNLTSIKNARGFFTTNVFDNIGRLTSTRNALGQFTTYVYDRNSNLTSTKDPSGAFLTSVYDSLDRLEVSIDALNYRTTFGYDKANNRTFIRDPRGNFVTYAYDSLNRVIAEHHPDGGIVTTVYDAAGNVQVKVNERGARTTYTYDKTNHRTVVQDALNYRTTFVYDSAYNVLSFTNPRGAQTTHAYDKANRLTNITDPLGKPTALAYDASGNQTARNEFGNIWTFVYDGLNRRTVEVNPLSQRTTTVYDEIGNVSAIVYPTLERVTYTYDGLNRIQVLTNPGGYWTTYGYDDANRKVTVKDFNSNISTQTFDARRMLSVAQTAELILNTFIYDSVGNREVAIDGKGQRTTFGYDSMSRLTFERDPLGFFTTFAYDDAGNRTLRRDPDGNWTTYAYDALNRLTTVSYTGATATMGYDQVGNLTSMVDSSGLLAQTYDLRNALLSKKRGSNIITYVYDTQGNRESLRDETGGLTTYLYDDLDRVTTIVDPVNYRTTFSYDSRGRRAQTQHLNNSTTTYTYATQGGIKSIESNSGATIYSRLEYTLDKSGRATAIKGGVSPNFSFTTYAYDKDYRLTAEHRTDPLTLSYAVTYAYDNAGNRTWHRDDGVFSTFTYDARNALTGIQRPGADFTTYTYDNRGNRTKKHDSPQVTTYTYDVESRLTRLDNAAAGELATYVYDYRGERVSWLKNTVLTTEIWDRQSLFAGTEGGNRTRYIETPSGMGDAVALVVGATAKIFVPNQIGSTVCTLGLGSPPPVSGRLILTAFGALKDEESTLGTNLRFVGEKQCFSDFTSGVEELIYMRARHYDPIAGAFLQKDPLGRTLRFRRNPYAYCQNSPIFLRDPTGLMEYLTDGESAFETNLSLPCGCVPPPEKSLEEFIRCISECLGGTRMPRIPELYVQDCPTITERNFAVAPARDPDPVTWWKQYGPANLTILHVEGLRDLNQRLRGIGPCECVKSVTFLDHGSHEGQFVGSAGEVLSAYKQGPQNTVNTVSVKDVFANVVWCPSCHVEYAGCGVAGVITGAIFGTHAVSVPGLLPQATADFTGCSVRAYWDFVLYLRLRFTSLVTKFCGKAQDYTPR